MSRAFLIHQLQVFIAKDLTLSLSDLLVLVLDLLGAPLVLLDKFLVGKLGMSTVIRPMLVLLADELLGSLTKQTLLLPVVLQMVLVLHSFLGELLSHIVTLAHPVATLDLVSLRLLTDGSLEIVTVLSSLDHLLNLAVSLFTLERFGLSLNNGTPFVQVAPGVRRVVPLVIVTYFKGLMGFVCEGFLDSLRADSEGIDQVVYHRLFYLDYY